MKKLRDSDFIRQRNATRRALLIARNPRKYDPQRKLKLKSRIGSRIVVVAPEELNFFGSGYDEFWKFINSIRQACSSGLVLLDFKPVRAVKVAALLVLYANIEQLQKLHGNSKIIKSTACCNLNIARKFQILGFWDLMRERRPNFKDAKVPGVPICTASSEDKEGGAEQTELRSVISYVKDIFESSKEDEQGGLAFAAITESVGNVWQHGYAKEFELDLPAHLQNWWIVVRLIEDQLFIGVYDMGVGIPKTLSIKSNVVGMMKDAYRVVRKFLKISPSFPARAFRDAASIKAAVDYGKSRFNTSGRGKGLSEAKDFVEANPMGTLMIYSGSGWYQYQTKGQREEARPLPFEFHGTLIQWNIKLKVPG
ncbi:hypothetical protein [Pseudomonas aeruginosa]|uniref:hypothetical protein n=1 Tax=Pseudomonas aeruginosa TaxID=287 RepID=UPI000B105BE2|nr:hypothetical protein [Pseudomonas aeruginosa]HBO9738237.1 hypothetical protein [Pseudomonas aeruginosa]